MIIGLHCPIREGLSAALEHARSLQIKVMQMLPYRRHHESTEAEMSAFRAQREAAGIRLLVHSRFVPSLACADEARRLNSVKLLAQELRLAAALGGEGYILHGGAYSEGGTLEEGIRLFGASVRQAASQAQCRLPILIENVPGGGRRMGGTLEELARLGDELGRLSGLGFCLDTAHAWAAGYDLSSTEAMLRFLSRAHHLLGSQRVRAFHLNDSRALLGSHREHHEHWGQGHVRSEGLKVLLERPEYAGVPGILETPPGEDGRNLDYVGRLVG